MSQDLINAIKKIADGSRDREMPMCFMMGKIESLDPLKIFVDDSFYIEEESIIVMREFIKDEEYDDHWHTIEPVDTTTVDKHKHKTEPHITDIAYYRGLNVGDKVVLLRNAGGQEFLILGRLPDDNSSNS